MVRAKLCTAIFQRLDRRIRLRTIVVGGTAEHERLLARLVEAVRDLSDKLGHLEGSFLARSLLVQKFEHLCH